MEPVNPELIAAIRALWHAHGGPSGEIGLRLCAVSGNNRVYAVSGAGGERVIAKLYYRRGEGERDRLTAEWRFLEHALRRGAVNVPRPVACDSAAGFALHEFIDGRKLEAAEIGPHEVTAAAGLITAINHPGDSVVTDLPDAAEAGFSVAAHFSILDRRLRRLDQISDESGLDRDARALARRIVDFWQERRAAILAGLGAMGITLDQEVPTHEQVISPSDFGFHNALMRPDGRLAFIDFEYAGRDDIAKLVADFFFQPAVPVPMALFDDFLQMVTAGMTPVQQAVAARRIRLLQPIFGIKWCCILLNRFLPDMAGRSQFADPGHDAIQRKRLQLDKATHALQTLMDRTWPT